MFLERFFSHSLKPKKHTQNNPYISLIFFQTGIVFFADLWYNNITGDSIQRFDKV